MKFLDNARVSSQDGTYFHEQDVIMSDYLYQGDIDIDLSLMYLNAGIGIIIKEDDAGTPENQKESYLFRVGDFEFSVLHNVNGLQTVLEHASTRVATKASIQHITFSKRGRTLELLQDRVVVAHCTMHRRINSFKIGIYSNEGNTLKQIDVRTEAPDQWEVNAKNARGGRIKFERNAIRFEKGVKDLEAEQSKIFLEKGDYYLSYKSEAVDGICDIEPYIFFSDDKRFDDKKKNILSVRKSFTVEEDAWLNLKFKGTSGIAREIAIKDNPSDDYVETDRDAITSSGSKMLIKPRGVSKVTWDGKVEKVPELTDLTEKNDYAVIDFGGEQLKEMHVGINLGDFYSYEVNFAKNLFSITKEESPVFQKTIGPSYPSDVAVFSNIKAEMKNVQVTTEEGEVIDVLLQRTRKAFVPDTIESPIIVTNVNYEPLDLSASFREDVAKNEYVFTNWEREIFEAKEKIKLNKKALRNDFSFVVYGIKKKNSVNLDRLYKTKVGAHSIDEAAPYYDEIPHSALDFDYVNNELAIKNNAHAPYESLIIDYLKDNSYAINHRPDLGMYEVDIAADMDSAYVIYNYNEEGSTGASYEYKYKNIGATGKYIVLRR